MHTFLCGYISEFFLFFSEARGGLCILKVVSVEYIYIVRYFPSLLSLQLWIQLWWQPSFPSICYIKGVYAAQSNLRINRRRLAWSSQDCGSTRNRPDSMFLFAAFMVCCSARPVSVYIAFQNASKFFSPYLSLWKQHMTVQMNLVVSAQHQSEYVFTCM